MRPLNRGDIVDIAQYEHERAALRDSVIKLKRHRRVSAGDLISLVFENRETMRFQVQEMMRVERIVLDDGALRSIHAPGVFPPAGALLNLRDFEQGIDQVNRLG